MAEYIDKHETYMMLKDLETAYMQIPVKEAYGTAARRIDQMEAADVQPVKHGKWIPQGDDMWLCSNCKENLIYSTTKSDRTKKQRYCCRCGARMDAIYQDDNITAIKVVGWDGDTE